MIGLNAVALVVVTTLVVAVIARAAVDGLPWAAAFALGAVVSPTDPLAATQITQRLGVPRRSTVVIEGEALINDGSALVLYRTAVLAAGGAAFVWWQAAASFVLAVVGVLVGLVVGVVVSSVSRVGRDDAFLGVVLSLTAGYLAYIPAEELHGSGVIASTPERRKDLPMTQHPGHTQILAVRRPSICARHRARRRWGDRPNATRAGAMKASEITWNDEARQKILDDADRALREAVVDLAGSMEGQGWEKVYEELFKRLEPQFVDFKPGPDLRACAEAVAAGDVEMDA